MRPRRKNLIDNARLKILPSQAKIKLNLEMFKSMLNLMTKILEKLLSHVSFKFNQRWKNSLASTVVYLEVHSLEFIKRRTQYILLMQETRALSLLVRASNRITCMSVEEMEPKTFRSWLWPKQEITSRTCQTKLTVSSITMRAKLITLTIRPWSFRLFRVRARLLHPSPVRSLDRPESGSSIRRTQAWPWVAHWVTFSPRKRESSQNLRSHPLHMIQRTTNSSVVWYQSGLFWRQMASGMSCPTNM